MEKDYLIAGLRVRMDSFGKTEAQAEGYLAEAEGEADIVITSDAEKFKERHPHLSLDSCEYLCTGSSFYRQVIDHDGMMLHASAVVKDGFAYLFSAPCGTGKSTHTDMWKQEFGNSVFMLNDDKPLLKKEKACWYAYGTPWSGKTNQNVNAGVPIGGICVLKRGETNKIEEFSGREAIFALLDQTARPKGADNRLKLLNLLDDLMRNVPVWRLYCTPTKEAARVSHEAMSEKAQELFGGIRNEN